VSNLTEFDVDAPVPGPPVRPDTGRSPLIWVAVGIVVAALAAAGYYFWYARTAGERGTTATEETVAPPPGQTAGPQADPIEVPPLDRADPLVRQLLAALSSHPLVASWLATNGLIRNFVVVVENVSVGQAPGRHLRPLRPLGQFRVVEGNAITIDPRTYARYDGIADAAASVDAAGAAKLYATLKPRIEEAYAELGRQEPFDAALERAITMLLRVPIPDRASRVEPSGAVEYEFSDPRYEELNGAQKQLLRMGPRNIRIIQGKLREVGAALGIPADRLD
jgi:hypothetical protein